MSAVDMDSALSDFKPEIVIHLAARTDTIENTTVDGDYAVNVAGSKNLINSVKKSPSVKRLIMTSSQFVCAPGRLPSNDEDFYPHTVYGHSKVETEKLTRNADLECEWTIIRPVNIWGAYHERYSREFWKIADKGLYFHPGVPSPTRTYGYVGNVVWQIIKILEADSAVVNKQVFYVGDRPISIDQWVMGFCQEFRGNKPWVIPMPLMSVLAMIGDIISKFTAKPFYITSSRLRSMTEDYYAPMDKTFEIFGSPPWSLTDGIQESVKWYKTQKSPKK